MKYDDQNIFAKILRAEHECQKIYENDQALAFYDRWPKAPLHALIIPKGPYRDAFDFNSNANIEEVLGFYRAVAEVISFLKLDQGYRLITNSGYFGQQEVPHYHLHLLSGEELGPIRSPAS